MLMLLTVWPLPMGVVAAGLGVLMLVFGGRSELVRGVLLLVLGLFPAASTLWLSVRADASGITVRNPFRRYRVPWDKVVLISSVESPGYYDPSHIEITRGGGWALPDGYSFRVAATFGLGDVERKQVVERLVAEGEALGFAIKTALGQPWEVWSTLVGEPESEPTETEYAWRLRVQSEAPELVRCAICGRIGPVAEMEPFGQNSEEPAWYCRENEACGTSSEASEAMLV